MSEEVKRSFWNRCLAGVSPQDRRNQKWIVGSNLAWAITYVGASLVLKRGWIEGPAAWALAVLPLLLGVVVVVVYSRFLRQTDELQRLVQLEALALGFGGSFFGFCAYTVFERLGAPALDLSDVTIGMVFLYIIGVTTGWMRYR